MNPVLNAPARTPGSLLALGAMALALLSLAFGLNVPGDGELKTYAWQDWRAIVAVTLIGIAALRALLPSARSASLFIALTSIAAALLWLQLPPATAAAAGAGGFWLVVIALALLAVVSLQRCAAFEGGRFDNLLAAALFGVWIIYFWQLLVLALEVPRVLLPAPELIGIAFFEHIDALASDFSQTVLKAVVIGWLLGSGLGFIVAIAIDRLPFLQRGLLPLASLTSAVPLVAVAPIAVMWFGFEWQSKAAVVVLMTFFPMLISTLAGLGAAGKLERELMFSYAAGYKRTLLDLRLPAAVPFIVGALKINATLALIGAIVAEFFGSPTVGLGFRISTEAGRMNMPLVWAAIVVAAITGTTSYALLVRLERRLAFWHPSIRSS
jgi:NitT/TauT family transport system permease protein